MTSSVPAWLAWPLIAAMAVVVAVRYRWFNKTLYENYFNNTLFLMLVAQLLRERAVEQLLERTAVMTVTMAQQLSLVLVFFMAGEFMGFITLWAQLSPEETRRRHRYHRVAAGILAAAFFVATTRARVNGQLLEVSGGWDNVIAWGIYAVLPVALGLQMVKMSIRESRRPGAKPSERLIAASGAVIGAAIGVTTLVAMSLELFGQLGWVDSLNYRLETHAYIFFWEAIGAAAVSAVPIGLAIGTYLGMDAHGRSWRQLQGLRQDMTSALPDALFDLESSRSRRGNAELKLHQTTIQIRDAILQLRPYYTVLDSDIQERFIRRHSVPAGDHAAAIDALQLAAAVRAKGSDVEPSPDGPQIVQSASTNLDEDAAELLALACWWPLARLYVSELPTMTHLSTTAKVNEND
ncbi:MAB_1171c family putative transporter [Mycobacteroides abscessus]|uniref:MAB_1171c family putative transporter n=1 Tax=Mycobacteroides abscessus TaxID=36809 RepID=UPI0009A5C2C7|nr:MAB_1171c family putative transporter [Mycobacteroides abscessus]SKO14877.1 Uncharacterised protein [Mycobacteroides abscessus subsp. bolletii]SKX37568.1 Uncharacterised protein [Mycobacteroides abscessus subsp. bolletii]